jgi:hypothetical protein
MSGTGIATPLGRVRGAAAPLLAALFLAVVPACTSAGSAGRGSTTSPDLRPAGTTASPTTSPSGTPTLSSGFDCTAVQEARRLLGDALATELDRLNLDQNSPAGFAVALIVTARTSREYWDRATTAVPPDLAAARSRVLTHWTGLDPALSQITIADGSAIAVARANRQLQALTGSGPDAQVAADEQTLQAAVDVACPLGG